MRLYNVGLPKLKSSVIEGVFPSPPAGNQKPVPDDV
jgi:hypothetical protein